MRREGRFFRVADPLWNDPLDGDYARERGGRWNPPGSFPVVYLARSVATARANVYRLLMDQPYGPEDLEPGSAPVLVTNEVPIDRYVDAVTARGLASLGLPPAYPLEADGRPVRRERCQAIGQSEWDAGERGIACRSAAPTAPAKGEELAYFDRGARLRAESTTPFEHWFWRSAP